MMNKLWDRFAGAHLRKAGKDYTGHGLFALKQGFVLIGAGLTSIVHGVFPFLFPFHSAKTVLRLADMVRGLHSYKHLND